MNAQSQNKKPSFFKTLPENIATSPTGIVKLSHSPFPSLDPSKHFRSVYERAGFDVYRAPNDKSRSTSRVASPTIEHGFRSQSTSQLNNRTSLPKVFDEKRNYSEHQYVGQKQGGGMMNYGEKTPGLNKAPLNIDANLANANASQRGDITAQISTTPSAATSTFDRSGGRPPYSSTSTTFTDADDGSRSSQSSSNVDDVATNHFVSAHSLPYSSKTDKNSRNSIPTVHTASPTTSHGTYDSNNEYSFAPRKQNTFGNNSPYQSERSLTQPPEVNITEEADESIDTVKYTPELEAQPRLKGHEELLRGSTIDKSLEGFNPISNSTNIEEEVSSHLGTPSDQEDISDDESFKSEILSPKFNFETSKDDGDLSDSFQNTNRDVLLDLPASPPHQPPSQIPQLFVSDSDGNIQYSTIDEKTGSPDFDGNNARESSFPMAASPIYTNEDKQNQPSVQIPEFEQIEEQEDEYEGEDFNNDDFNEDPNDQEETSAPVYEEIEQQLESLSMRSPQPPQIMIHSVKEVSTEDVPKTVEAPKPPAHGTALPEQTFGFGYSDQPQPEYDNVDRSLQNDNQYQEFEQGQQQQLEQQIIEQEPEVPKWPWGPGEGPCRKCGLEIERKPIYSKSGELSGQWHRECFTCTSCDLTFSKNTTCFVLKDLPYCEYHYHLSNNSLCKVCGSGIVGKCLENDASDRYHIDCLRCTQCGDQIKSDYLSINNMVHCEACATEYTSSSNLGVDNGHVIERRRTKLYFVN